MLLDIVVKLLPRGAHARLVGDVEENAAGFRLVRERCGLRLHCDRKADLLCGCDRFIRALGQCAVGDFDARSGQHLLAEPFGLSAAAEFRQILDRHSGRRILSRPQWHGHAR